MWSNYDSLHGNIFSFGEDFKFLNERIRASLLGGPTICFQVGFGKESKTSSAFFGLLPTPGYKRHCEINSDDKNWHESVTECANGENYKKIISYDFNGLYLQYCAQIRELLILYK